jgi:outer membrane protein assembly factor BamE (lipoprotein component of BamABCDE complex)
VYSVYSAVNPSRQSLFSHELDRSFALNQADGRGMVRKHQQTGATTSAGTQIAPGSTRDQVLAAFGQPSSIDLVNDRWIYGSHIILFKHDRVAGCLKPDAFQAARMACADLMRSGAPDDAKPAKSATKARTQATAKRSSRPAYAARGRAGSPSASYFSVWEPMYRPFYSDRPLPHGMSPVAPRYGNPAYRGNRYQGMYPLYNRH